MDDFQTRVIQDLQLHQDANKGISIPNWALDLVSNDFHTAIFLKQVVFWSTKTNHPDGFYKSYKEWESESRLSRYHVQQAIKVVHELAGCELITITKKKVNGAPTLFYRLDWEAFYQWICKSLTNGNATVLQMESENTSQMDLQASRKSLRADRDLHTDTPQTEIADSFSSPTLSAPPVVAAVEEKEISKPSDPVLEMDEVSQRRLDAFAKLVGVYGGSSPRMKAELAGGLQTIMAHDPDVQPSSFQRFQEYHQEQNQNRKVGPRYPLPTIKYVVDGWGQFKAWWESRRTASQWEFIPGTENYLGMDRWEWDELTDMLPGELIQIRGEWVYRKQADETFAEVPHTEWPVEWLKESA